MLAKHIYTPTLTTHTHSHPHTLTLPRHDLELNAHLGHPLVVGCTALVPPRVRHLG